MPSCNIGGLSQPGVSLYNIEYSNRRLITFPGGLPSKNAQGEIIGVFCDSGSAADNDHTLDESGLSGL